jgi:UDP-N-acetylglucosamine:LPS N-acetylglucosamine transferase
MPRRVLLVASGGGHWVQLLRLRAAWEHADVAYLTVQASYQRQVPGARFYAVHDATRWSRLSLVFMALQVAWVVLRERPDVIITTGAAPGLVALWVGKKLGARTAWLDSIANVEEMSLSGRRAAGCSDFQLTQWPHLEADERPAHRGAVL